MEAVKGTVAEAIDNEEVCRKYRWISRNRPPFVYTPQRTAKYPEADEGRLFEMEERTFKAADYPRISPELGPLSPFWDKLQESAQALNRNIEEIKEFDPLHQAVHGEVSIGVRAIRVRFIGSGTAFAIEEDRLETKPPRLYEVEKKLWEAHYKLKKNTYKMPLLIYNS